MDLYKQRINLFMTEFNTDIKYTSLVRALRRATVCITQCYVFCFAQERVREQLSRSPHASQLGVDDCRSPHAACPRSRFIHLLRCKHEKFYISSVKINQIRTEFWVCKPVFSSILRQTGGPILTDKMVWYSKENQRLISKCKHYFNSE